MKTQSLKHISVLGLLSLALFATGCGKPEQGEKGERGQDGGRIVSTINCFGKVSGAGPLDGLKVEYNAVLTSSGDVYATAAVIDEAQQYSGTSFYSAGQTGSDTAKVVITADYVGAANGGTWDISLDRRTLQPTAQYIDPDFNKTMVFAASACKKRDW